MSAQKATSGIVFRNIDGVDRLFRTITTYENSKITNTKIQEVIGNVDDEKSKSLYNTRLLEAPDLVSEDDDGFYYTTVRDGGTDTVYADFDLRKSFEEQNSTGVVSLTNDLNAASIDDAARIVIGNIEAQHHRRAAAAQALGSGRADLLQK